MIKITIAIPTYNRNEKAARQVEAVLAQMPTQGVELLVVDNASDTPVSHTLEAMGMLGQPGLRIVRNPANVGLAANISRCFEYATGEWVWLLGDDDHITEDAYRIVDHGINGAAADAAAMQFSYSNMDESRNRPTDIYKPRDIRSVAEACAFFNSGATLSHLMFISTLVIRRTDYLSQLALAYHWNNTVAPHVAVILASLRAGKTLSLKPEIVIRKIVPDEGDRCNSHRIRMGLQTLIEIEGIEQETHAMFHDLMYEWNGGRKSALLIPRQCFRSDKGKAFWDSWYLRGAASTRGFTRMIFIGSAIIVTPFGCSPWIRKIVNRKGIPRSDSSGIGRS